MHACCAVSVLLMALGTTVTASMPQSSASDELDTIRALTGLHETNRVKFSGVRIEFEYLDGYAKSVDEAAAGKIQGSTTSGAYYCDGEDAIYECVFPDAAILSRTQRLAARKTSSSLNSIRMLTNGKLTLIDRTLGNDMGRVGHATIILPGSREFYKQVEIPINIGFPDDSRDDLAYMAKAVLQTSSGYELINLTPHVLYDGKPVVRVTIKSGAGSRVMWIDPERGGVVLRTRDEMLNGDTRELIHSDLRLLPAFGWLPFQRLLILNNARVRRTVVTSVQRPAKSRERFRLAFPGPVPIVNVATQVAYRPQKVWDLSQLPSRDSGNAVQMSPLVGDPSLPIKVQERSRQPLFTYAALAISVLICGGMVIRKAVARRHWKRAT